MPATLDHRELKRRHPLCPQCGYDLVATFAANRRVCPECGEAFDVDELNWESKPGDWNTRRALVLGGRALTIRMAIALPLIIGAASLAIAAVTLELPRIVLLLLALAQSLPGWIDLLATAG